jgi:hypothetical protein
MATPRRPWYTILYVQVLLAIVAGILIGHYFSNLGVALKPLGDGFISLIKMMIGPVIFCTVVHGIGSMRDLGASWTSESTGDRCRRGEEIAGRVPKQVAVVAVSRAVRGVRQDHELAVAVG